MTTPKQSPTPSLDSVSDLLSRQSPPDSSTVEPRSSRFTVVDALWRVKRDDGRYYTLRFDNMDAVRYGNDGTDCLIGVSGIDVAEAMDLEDMAQADMPHHPYTECRNSQCGCRRK